VWIRLVLAAAVLVATLSGCRSVQTAALAVPGCVGARVSYFQEGRFVTMSVEASTCRDGRELVTTDVAFDRLGRAAWRAPGMTTDDLVITIDRYADERTPGAPKTIVLVASQAVDRWGVHPVPPGADRPRDLAVSADTLLGLGLTGLAVMVAILVYVGLVSGLRRSEIVVMWWWPHR
jgi:hypothetical protein